MATPEFIYRLRAARDSMLCEGPTEREQSVIAEHVAYLADLVERGVVVLAGRTQNADPDGFGIVILRAPDTEAARAIMENDPGVRDGVMHATLFPFRIALGPSAP